MPDKKNYNISKFNSALADFYSQPVAKMSLELFLSFGLVIILTIVAIQPTLTTIAKLNEEVQEKKDLTSKLASKISAVNTAIDTYTQYSDQIALLDQTLPPTAQLIPTLKIIEKMANENNVIITNMSVSKVPDEVEAEPTSVAAPLTTLPISVSVMGQYQNMKQFV